MLVGRILPSPAIPRILLGGAVLPAVGDCNSDPTPDPSTPTGLAPACLISDTFVVWDRRGALCSYD
jgi:hypothetical protein